MKLGDCASVTERTGTPVAHSRVAACRQTLPEDLPRMTLLFLRAERLSVFFSLLLFFFSASHGLVAQPEETWCVGAGAAHLLRLSNSAASAKDLEMCVARRRHISTRLSRVSFRPRAAGPSATHVSFSATSVLAASVVVAATTCAIRKKNIGAAGESWCRRRDFRNWGCPR